MTVRGFKSEGEITEFFLFPIFPYSVQIRENTDQKYSVFGHFSCSVRWWQYYINWNLLQLKLMCKTDVNDSEDI